MSHESNGSYHCSGHRCANILQRLRGKKKVIDLYMLIANHSSHFCSFQLQCHGFSFFDNWKKENVRDKRIHEPWSIIMCLVISVSNVDRLFFPWLSQKSSSVCQSNRIHFVCVHALATMDAIYLFFPIRSSFSIWFDVCSFTCCSLHWYGIYQVIECIEQNSMWQRSLAAESTQFSVSREWENEIK